VTAAATNDVGLLRADPVAAQRLAALAGTISITGGLAVGPLLGGLLAQYAPAPRVTPLAVHLGLVAVAIALALSIPARRTGAGGNLAQIAIVTPAAERGGVLGAVYFINYTGLGVPVIGVGVLSLWTGLETATTVAAIVIAIGCLSLIPLVTRRQS
jgi:hypothetical protein